MPKNILDFIFPIECLGCKKENEWLCSNCLTSIPFKQAQLCISCRQPTNNGLTCFNCKKNIFLDGCLSAGDYEHPLLTKIIKTCKYSFVKELIPVISLFIFSFLEKNPLLSQDFLKKETTYLVPIPLHKKRLNWRGFNQSEILAQLLSQKLGIKTLSNLSRIKNNTPQAKLSGEKRRENISNCFIWKGESLKGKKIILIDDVATTGATLNEAAHILKDSGAQKIIAITAARG